MCVFLYALLCKKIYIQNHTNQGYNNKIPSEKMCFFSLLNLKYLASNDKMKGTFKCKKQYFKKIKGIYYG